MSGREFCEAIEDKKQQLKNNKKAISVVTGFATGGLNRLWEKEEGDEENEVYNFIRNSYNKVKDTISLNYCSNIIGSVQDNIFIQDPSCFKNIQTLCYNDKTKQYNEECLDKLYKLVDISNSTRVNQTNIDTQLAECNINSVLGILTQQEQTLQNLAIIKLIQEEQQKNKKSTSDTCNEINSDITKEQYIRSFLDCTNLNIINQKNLIRSECNPNVSAQINVNRGINRCIVESNIANKMNNQITQKIVIPHNFDNPSQNQSTNENTNGSNSANKLTNPSTNSPNNQSSLILMIAAFCGFIFFMVFLFYIFKR
jgi:hypothetical protein